MGRTYAATHADAPAAAADQPAARGTRRQSGRLEQPERVAHALVDDGSAGVLLVAENLNEIVGVLASAADRDPHPGRYGDPGDAGEPAFRGMTMGGDLISRCSTSPAAGVRRLEVGLPTSVTAPRRHRGSLCEQRFHNDRNAHEEATASNVIQPPNRTTRAPRLATVEQRMDASVATRRYSSSIATGRRWRATTIVAAPRSRRGLTRDEGVDPDIADAEDEYVEACSESWTSPATWTPAQRGRQEPTMMPSWRRRACRSTARVGGRRGDGLRGRAHGGESAERAVNGAQFSVRAAAPPAITPARRGPAVPLSEDGRGAHTRCATTVSSTRRLSTSISTSNRHLAIVAPL